jgi:hypothetical protein
MRTRSRRFLLYSTLAAAITTIPSNAVTVLSHLSQARGPERSSSVRWRVAKTIEPSCFKTDLPEAGLWWIEMRSSTPASNPGMIFLPTTDFGPELRFLERTETVMVAVSQAGQARLCLTSQAPLDDVRLTSRFLARKGGDPKEIEIEPDPQP